MASSPTDPAKPLINYPVAGQEMSVIVSFQQTIARVEALTRAILELQQQVAALQARL